MGVIVHSPIFLLEQLFTTYLFIWSWVSFRLLGFLVGTDYEVEGKSIPQMKRLIVFPLDIRLSDTYLSCFIEKSYI